MSWTRFCPTVTITVRRLHDTGHSAWWISLLAAFWLCYFVTSKVEIYIVAVIFAFLSFILFVTNFILLFCADSQHGENQYGPNPKADK